MHRNLSLCLRSSRFALLFLLVVALGWQLVVASLALAQEELPDLPKRKLVTPNDVRDDLIESTAPGRAEPSPDGRHIRRSLAWVSGPSEAIALRGGARSKREVVEAVQSSGEQLRHCFQGAVQTNPDLAGRLMVRFSVSPEGKVEHVGVVRSSLRSDSTERCVAGAIARLQFKSVQTSSVATQVWYPFDLAGAADQQLADAR